MPGKEGKTLKIASKESKKQGKEDEGKGGRSQKRLFFWPRFGLLSAFLKHAFREVTTGFCKGTVPGASPRPSPGPLTMPKNNSKETYSVPPKGHLLVKNMWSDSQVKAEVPHQGRPLPRAQGPKNAQRLFLKTVLGTRPESTFAPRHVWETPTKESFEAYI